MHTLGFILIGSYKLSLWLWLLRNFLGIEFWLTRIKGIFLFIWCLLIWWIVYYFFFGLENFPFHLLLFLDCLLNHLFLLFDLYLINLIWIWSNLFINLLLFGLLYCLFSIYLLLLLNCPRLLLINYYFSIIVRGVYWFL